MKTSNEPPMDDLTLRIWIAATAPTEEIRHRAETVHQENGRIDLVESYAKARYEWANEMIAESDRWIES